MTQMPAESTSGTALHGVAARTRASVAPDVARALPVLLPVALAGALVTGAAAVA